MTLRKTAIYGVGGALLVAYLAAANMPGSGTPARGRAQQPPSNSGDALAAEIRSQASRLREKMSQAPVPDPSVRNPFAFGAGRAGRAAPAAVRAAVVEAPVAPALPPPPALTLMGIAEETLPGSVRRTAVIGGEADALYMVAEGQSIGDRYRVTKIGVDAVELEDLITKGYRRLAMR
jgi:hypothetical protein